MTRLSTLQYNMLRMFASDTDSYMSIADAQQFDQRPFRSMLVQQWVAYRPGKGFHITRKGRDAYRDFETHDITRRNSSAPLTAYFDPTAYGLRVPVRKAPKSEATRLKVVA